MADSLAGSSRLLRLLHLASPALPIGAFHFSQGLEYAIEAGWVSDEATARDWISGLARESIGTLDLPILARLRRAWAVGDEHAIEHWNARIIASRETEELRAEDRHMGQALARILADLEIAPRDEQARLQRMSYPAVFARACAIWSIPEHETLQTYAWTWLENQTLAAVKAVPLGQSAGQRILHSLIEEIERIAARASQLGDDDIGTGSVMQAFASARHEEQYTRLFKS
jgi:Urease accessory protein UreF